MIWVWLGGFLVGLGLGLGLGVMALGFYWHRIDTPDEASVERFRREREAFGRSRSRW